MEPITFNKKCVNKKTKLVYFVASQPCTNCTNKNDGQQMILYIRDGKLFVRDSIEFFDKFEFI